MTDRTHHVRNNYERQNVWCMFSGCEQPAAETHEIARGGMRSIALDHPAACLRLCRRHHEMMGGKSYEWQLAHKKHGSHPDETYNLETFRYVVQGAGPRYARIVEEEDVDQSAREQGIL